MINQFNKIILEKFFNTIKNISKTIPKVDTIYHYTSQSAYLNIIKTKELWLSHISNLNDPQELSFGLKVIKENIENKITNDKSIILEWINEIDPFNTHETKNVFYEPIFLMSFSKEPDDMSQWISYGDNGHGVSLSFLLKEIIPTLSDLSYEPILMPVSYFPENWKISKSINLDYLNTITNFIIEIDNNIYSLNEKNLLNDIGILNSIKREFLEYLYIFASYIKHDFYKQEKEWRLFINTSIGNPNISIKPDGNKVMMVYKLQLKELVTKENPHPEKNPLYINKIHKDIIIGPRYKNNHHVKTALEIGVYQELHIGPGGTISFSSGKIK